MGILSWILLGLVAGILAKIIMPGKDGGGFYYYYYLGYCRCLCWRLGWLFFRVGVYRWV